MTNAPTPPSVPISDAVVSDPAALFRRLNPYAVDALRQQPPDAQMALQRAIAAEQVRIRFEVDAAGVWVLLNVGGADLARVLGTEVLLHELIDEATQLAMLEAEELCAAEVAAGVPDDLSALGDTPPAA